MKLRRRLGYPASLKIKGVGVATPMMLWHELLEEEFEKPYLKELFDRVTKDRHENIVFPIHAHTFTALEETPPDKVKVVILGQDPYHGFEQAHGLAFSVQRGQRVPPSLVNIYKELEQDIPDFRRPGHGCLLKWAQEGVLLLNSVLTVRSGEPGSHRSWGWETFTNVLIQKLSEDKEGLVFLLWGRYAQEKTMFIDSMKHTVLTSAHPSPLSAKKGFFGCRHFSKANEALVAAGKEPVDWQL